MRTLHLPREYAIVKQPVKPLPGGTPLKSFPRWLKLISESKIPVGLLPREEFLLTTRQLTQSLYRKYPHQDFDLSDPYLHYLPSNEYNALSDPNCRHYFYRPSIYRHLMKEGFISESNRVIVNLADFNKYRAYLNRLHVNEIKQFRRREYENMLYEKAILERRRLQQYWNSTEYRSIQEKRARCIDLCRQLRDLDEAERKRYLRFYTADVKRNPWWKREELMDSANNKRLNGIERQLLEKKEIKERSMERKQLMMFEWMKKIKEHEERHQDMKIVAEIDRFKKKQERANFMRKYQEIQIPIEEEMRKLDELDKKEAVELRKALVNIRKQKAYNEFMQIRKQRNLRRFPIKKTNFNKNKQRDAEEKINDQAEQLHIISSNKSENDRRIREDSSDEFLLVETSKNNDKNII
ncbi:trichohyalin-like [Centruroides sculpturatus]|uniref:trichohyalin-like n=1 Tax=Centruroides sculpturatus TaxID=218467 RepID=UPI000C6E0B25|nr:trichohyalin-like [Centruroides sculpturatus]